MNRTLKATAVLMLIMFFAAGCTKPDEPNNVSGNYNGHDFVDLGLPSGTLWATCNVGAETPEGYGDYYAWGEIEPKTLYEWSTYKYCNGDFDQLTRYCSDSICGYNGFTDNLYVLQPSDDAATVNWGEGWRMPSASEGEELLSQCSHQRDTVNGVSGWRIIGPNGNTIFMPAGGAKGDFIGPDPESLQVGGHGYFWVNEKFYVFNNQMIGNIDHMANFISLPVVYSAGGRTERMIGMSIRAVRSAE